MKAEELGELVLERVKLTASIVLSKEMLNDVHVKVLESAVADVIVSTLEAYLKPWAGLKTMTISGPDDKPVEIKHYHVCPHATWDEDKKHLTFMRASLEPQLPDPDMGICQRLTTALERVMGSANHQESCYCDEIRRCSPNDFKPCDFCQARQALRHAKSLGLEVKGEWDGKGE